jgi:hypothetical protein
VGGRQHFTNPHEIARQRPDALMINQDNVLWLTRSKIAQAMSRYRIPAVHGFREAVAEGGLMSYANSTGAMFRGGVRIVWKIRWRILPMDEVHDQPAALAGGHRRNAPWASVSGMLRERRSLSPSLSGS